MEPAPEKICPECGEPLTPSGSSEVGVAGARATQYDHYTCPECEGRYHCAHEDGRLRSVED
jgi:RNase P subunit RPR2